MHKKIVPQNSDMAIDTGRLWIVLDGEYTTLNKYVNAERSNRYAGAAIKKAETSRVTADALGCEPVTNYPLDVTIFWYRRDRRSDPDNISAAVKFVFDGLQDAGIIRADGWREINSICHVFKIDKKRPRVEIFLESE